MLLCLDHHTKCISRYYFSTPGTMIIMITKHQSVPAMCGKLIFRNRHMLRFMWIRSPFTHHNQYHIYMHHCAIFPILFPCQFLQKLFRLVQYTEWYFAVISAYYYHSETELNVARAQCNFGWKTEITIRCLIRFHIFILEERIMTWYIYILTHLIFYIVLSSL